MDSVVIPGFLFGIEVFLLDFPAGQNLLDARGIEPVMPNSLAAHRTTTPSWSLNNSY
jgi:hypothetical protein